MPIIRFTFCLCVLITSQVATAGVITYAGYSYDDSTNVVEGGGLEWLRWTETLNISRNDAIDLYSSQGWRLANLFEITALYESYFGTVFESISYGSLGGYHNYNSADTIAYNKFIDMFGDTFQAFDAWYDPGGMPDVHESMALFDNEGVFDFAYVGAGGIAILDKRLSMSMSESDVTAGVALVRIASAPEPSTIILLVLALAGLGVNRRKYVMN